MFLLFTPHSAHHPMLVFFPFGLSVFPSLRIRIGVPPHLPDASPAVSPTPGLSFWVFGT